jgi:DNA-binding beta-propeller fold protein YncE
MVQSPAPPLPPAKLRPNTIATWIVGVACFGILLFILAQLAYEVVHPTPAPRLTLVRDIPLPSALPPQFVPNARDIPKNQNTLAPGVAVPFDHFDFQALDPNTHLLFIAHSGPATDIYTLAEPSFDADKDSQVDGNVVVFDTRSNIVVGLVPIPQVAGIVVAPDLGRVFAADANDNIVYSIDEHTLKATPIALANNEGPDGIDYDPIDHKVFVSDPGVPTPDNVNPDNQNLSVINLITNKVSRINLGHLPKLSGEDAALVKFGYDVGHNHYDPVLRRVFVTIQQLTDQSVVNPATPPGGTGELVTIDPVTQKVVTRLQLPKTCGTPHGMNIDMQEQIAFIACTDVDSTQNLVQNLIRVDLRTMSVIHDPLMVLPAKPDIVVMDSPLHLVFVGCSGGVAVFYEGNRTFSKLGTYILGKNTHSLAIDPATQTVYLPQTDVGGRPVLRIAHYNPAGS